MSRLPGVVTLLLSLALLGWIAGCEGNDVSSCFDTEDNDGDGYYDCADPGCAQFCGDGDDDDDASDDDASDDDAADDDAGDDDAGDDDVGDDDVGDDDVGDDDVGDDDMGDDDVGYDEALLIEDTTPWGYTSWSDQLYAAGISTTTIGSWSVSNTNLFQYELVITSSVQGGPAASSLNGALADFEAYVLGGGVLVWSVCTHETDTPYPQIPFGGTPVFHLVEDNVIAIPAHPLVSGVAPPFTGNYATHNHVANPPNNATVILAHPTYGDPVLYTLEQGLGLLIVHGNPLEFQSGDNDDNEQVLANIVDFGWAYSP